MSQNAGSELNMADLFAVDDIAVGKIVEARKEIHCSESRREEAEALLANFGSVAKKLSTESKADCRKGVVCWALGKNAEAIRILENVRSSKERNLFIGLAHMEIGNSTSAHTFLGEAVQNDPDDLFTQICYAEAKAKCGMANEAMAMAEKLQKKAKDSLLAEVHYVRGLCHDMQGNYQDAEKAYESAMEIDGSHAPSLFRIAYNLDIGGEDEKAREIYEQLSQMRPPHINTLLNLAVIYEDSGEYDKAIKCCKNVIECSPNHQRARIFLSDIEASKTMYYDEEASKREAKISQLFATPISEMNFSTRVREGLAKIDVKTVGELTMKDEEDLLTLPNFGKTSLMEVKEALHTRGLTLDKDAESQAALAAETQGPVSDDILQKTLADFEWSGRIKKVYEKMEIKTIGDLLQKTESELLKSKNLGATSIKEIRKKLSTLGVSMKLE